MRSILFFTLTLLMLGCKSETKHPEIPPLSGDEIVDKTIDVSGGNSFANSEITFMFRNKQYFAKRANGSFLLSRLTVKNNDSILDKLSNNGFKRKVNNKTIQIPDSMATKYAASVNSVHYFSVLPHGLNDKAVNKRLLGEEQIRNKTYYKVEVTFSENGGGEDFEDVFIYWIHKSTFKTDYLAYSYEEEDGKGMRFRKAYNERYVEGLRFVDYNNFKPENDSLKLIDLGKAFESEQLKLLSKIELEDVDVSLINR